MYPKRIYKRSKDIKILYGNKFINFIYCDTIYSKIHLEYVLGRWLRILNTCKNL